MNTLSSICCAPVLALLDGVSELHERAGSTGANRTVEMPDSQIVLLVAGLAIAILLTAVLVPALVERRRAQRAAAGIEPAFRAHRHRRTGDDSGKLDPHFYIPIDLHYLPSAGMVSKRSPKAPPPIPNAPPSAPVSPEYPATDLTAAQAEELAGMKDLLQELAARLDQQQQQLARLQAELRSSRPRPPTPVTRSRVPLVPGGRFLPGRMDDL